MKRIIKVVICCILAVSMLTPMTAMAASRLATPTGFKVVTTTTSSVRVKWNKVEGAGKYTIQYSTNKKFKKAKKITVKGPAATVKKLAAKKVYYFRVRATKKGRKASAYTKTVKAKTVFNVDKKLKGSWVNSEFYMGTDGVTILKFNGKGKVAVRRMTNVIDKKQTVSYKKGKNNTVTFKATGMLYSIKCYQDSAMIYVAEKDNYGTYHTMYTRYTDYKKNSQKKFEDNFLYGAWRSNYLTSEFSKYLGYTVYPEVYMTKSDGYLITNYYADGYTDDSVCSIIKNNIMNCYLKLGNYNYYIYVERTSFYVANAFIYKYNYDTGKYVSFKKDTWILM